MKKLLFCTVPQDLIKEPLLFTLGKEFDVIPNIKGASVTDSVAILTLEIEGEEERVDAAETFLRKRGVQVEELPPSGLL